jgi:hypothetical protein
MQAYRKRRPLDEEAIPHGDHVDYVVNGHLHHPHNGHCDNHGNVQLAN